MSWFPEHSLEDEILSDVQYFQREHNASDVQIINALVEVLSFFSNKLEKEQK